SAALMSFGLLYEGSAHPPTMKILLGEIGRKSGVDNVLEREGYAVAAGTALGFVGLGQGQDAFGVTDNFVDQLFQFVGGKEFCNDRFLKLKKTTDEQNRNGQMIDGAMVNVDVTAPGSTIALALIFLKTECEAVAARFSIPATHFDLQFVRPDFIMFRIIARNLILWNSVYPSREWIEAQIPEFVKISISRISDNNSDTDDIDVEAVVQAYVNIVTGACISIGLKFAGTRNAEAHDLLYDYAVHFLNEIKPISSAIACSFPEGLSQFVDRGTLETCLHVIALSLSVVMAGTGHLKTFRLLRHLRNRKSSSDQQFCYGFQMAVSLAIGFLFLGGGMQTFSTGNSAVAALLITMYPRFPRDPNDNRCHLQAFRHLYVIATESRMLQTIDVDTGLTVYAPLQITTSETQHYTETSFCEITPCILPERAILKTVRVCGPRYWPQVIQLHPEDTPWWKYGDMNSPLNGGILYIKRKVGTCSYVDDPIGCQSLLSRVMHKVSESSLVECSVRNTEFAVSKVDQLISTFSADPSLISFAHLCCDASWNSSSDADFRDFCSQVLFECMCKERPSLLQVYLSLYTNSRSMWEQVNCGHIGFFDSQFLLSFKVAIAYNEAISSGRFGGTKESIIQPTFLESLKIRVEEILSSSKNLKADIHNYLRHGKWSTKDGDRTSALFLSWYLLWYRIPHYQSVQLALEKIKKKKNISSSSSVPLLHLLLPTMHIKAVREIDDDFKSSSI
ncbi:Anaphase-promoting complex subunit, partial [Zostera marina]